MDVVLKLRELRRMRGLSQKDVAEQSGVGEKTISSFETGQRISSLKLDQLERILGVYGITEREFFSGSLDVKLAPWESEDGDAEAFKLVEDLRVLPRTIQQSLLGKFSLMLETASEVHSLRDKKTHSFMHDQSDWQLLTSRN